MKLHALLAALLLVPALSPAAQLSELPAVPRAELGALPAALAPLAVRLRASIPTVRALDLAVPAAAGAEGARAVPAAYATARAEALLGRLAESGAIEPRRPMAAAEPADAKKTVAAVNAVLRDFTPEQIQKLPQEKLAALSAALFDHLGERPASREEHAAAAAALSEASGARMLSQRGPLRETLLNPGHNDSHPDEIEVHGVPQSVKPAQSEGVVWRHYTTKEGYQAIVETGLLQNGYVPYVQLSRGAFKKVFKDVGGVFLTKPGVSGADVGVPKSDFPHYVDLKLPPSVTVLEVEAGSIWLVPLVSRARGWIAGLYRAWADTGKADPTYHKAVVSLEAAGGPGAGVSIPVEIVKKGEAQ